MKSLFQTSDDILKRVKFALTTERIKQTCFVIYSN